MTDRGRLAIVGAGMLWGTAGTAQALGQLAGMGFGVGAARTVVAAAALALIAAISGRRLPALTLPAVGAGVALALYQVMFFVGAAKAGVAVGTLIAVGLAPAIAGGVALCLGRAPGRTWVVATVPAVLGLTLLVYRDGGPPVDPWGIVASVTAAGAYVGYTALTRRLLELGTPPRDALPSIFAVATCVSVPIIAANWHQTALTVGHPRGLTAILVLGTVSTVIPYLMWVRGMRTVPTALATTLSLSEPLVGTLLGVAVLHERLTPLRAAGAALIVAALAVVSVSGRRPP